MSGFVQLLRENRNYRNLWSGQVVSEVGDHFNNIAVFSLVLETTGSGLIVSGVLLARGVAMMIAGPLAGVALDRMDRRKLMIASDAIRAVIAVGFGLCLLYPKPWLLYVLSAMLMFCSPFFTSGRAAILPRIASREQLHTANTLTQTTQWTNLAIGMVLGGTSVHSLGYEAAFALNALSFVVSAFCISRLRLEGGFRPAGLPRERMMARPFHEYREGLRYMRSVPLVFGLALLGVGWATGGGAAQVLFSLFGEKVFHKGAAGIGIIWGCAAIGLIVGGATAHRLMPRLSFRAYLWLVAACYLLHGVAYAIFSQMENFGWALFFIALSRAAVGMTSTMNMTQLLRTIDDAYRGRVFSTFESMNWGMMMISMTLAGFASDYYSIRTIGLLSGIVSGSVSIFWVWAVLAGKLVEPGTESRT
ncbi:MAG: MFS transporter [Bryobacteraceae bacterium]